MFDEMTIQIERSRGFHRLDEKDTMDEQERYQSKDKVGGENPRRRCMNEKDERIRDEVETIGIKIRGRGRTGKEKRLIGIGQGEVVAIDDVRLSPGSRAVSTRHALDGLERKNSVFPALVWMTSIAPRSRLVHLSAGKEEEKKPLRGATRVRQSSSSSSTHRRCL